MQKTEQRMKDLKEIAIVIDNWDDIFSDFDPRPLSERTLSEDFIVEIGRRYTETKRGGFVLTIYAPVSLEDKKSEGMVSKRLKEHFKLKYLQIQKGIIRARARGIIFVIGGILLLTFITLAAYYKWFVGLILEVVGIVVLPLGWFGIWEGFSKIVDVSEYDIRQRVFFEKLSKAKYQFIYLGKEPEKDKSQASGGK